MTKDNTYQIISLLKNIKDKNIVDKDLRDIMVNNGMTRYNFYGIFERACSMNLIAQTFNGKNYVCSLTKDGKEELETFKFMFKENFLKNKKS